MKSSWMVALLGILLVAGGAAYLFLPNQAKSPQTPTASTTTPSLSVATSTTTSTASSTPLFHYIEIVDSCGPYYDLSTCVSLRSGPSTSTPIVMQLRDGMVFKVASTTVHDGYRWYEIGFDGEIHYPERKRSPWWVAAEYTKSFYDPGEMSTTSMNASSTKKIVVDLATQTLYAYDGTTLFMQQPISTGLTLTPTPVGHFFVMRKLPDSYMQGPIPGLSSQYYDLPGVPWDLYFTREGAAIHGTYWHNHFGQKWSHGCVNLPVAASQKLYDWAPLGTPVIVK